MISERQQNVARRLAAGYSQRHTAVVEGVGRGTIVRWLRIPEFVAEMERARAARLDPTPRGTLLEAMYAARKDDQIDWSNRVRAALALMDMDDPADEGDDVVAGWVT